jgi:hypothetical protein
MAAVNAYSTQLTLSLLEDTTTVLSSPGSEETGSVGEAYGGLPSKIDAGASDENVKLGALTDPLVLAVWGEQGVSFKIASDGDAIAAYPFACLSNVADGLGISEIWVSNSEDSEKSYTVLAVE